MTLALRCLSARWLDLLDRWMGGTAGCSAVHDPRRRWPLAPPPGPRHPPALPLPPSLFTHTDLSSSLPRGWPRRRLAWVGGACMLSMAGPRRRRGCSGGGGGGSGLCCRGVLGGVERLEHGEQQQRALPGLQAHLLLWPPPTTHHREGRQAGGTSGTAWPHGCGGSRPVCLSVRVVVVSIPGGRRAAGPCWPGGGSARPPAARRRCCCRRSPAAR